MSNANKVIPVVELTLGEKTLKLCFDTWAACLVEKETGKPLLDEDRLNNAGLYDVVTMVWAATQLKHPKLKIQDVARMITPENMEAAGEAILNAVMLAFGKDGENDKEEEGKKEQLPVKD